MFLIKKTGHGTSKKASRHNVYHQEYHQVPLLLICVKYFKIGLGEKLRF